MAEVATRDLQRMGPIRKKDRLEAGLGELQAHHHVRVVKDGKRRWVAINPTLMGGATA